MNKFFSLLPLWQNKGIAVTRIIVGASLIYHGCEVFNTTAMNEYLKWDVFRDSTLGKTLVYSGKAFELTGGILLFPGFLTRIACIIIICTLAYIAFFIGHGKIWYQDQHPFLFVIPGFIFIFTGPGSFSLDNLVFKTKIYLHA